MGRQFERARLECGGAQNSVGFIAWRLLPYDATRCSKEDRGLAEASFWGKTLEVLGIDRFGLASSGRALVSAMCMSCFAV